MDGLAMALWALWNSNSFAHALLNAVNLLGDADTVGAIVGQMAGALYGFKRIISDEWSVRCVKNLMHWDKGPSVSRVGAIKVDGDVCHSSLFCLVTFRHGSVFFSSATRPF